MAIFIILSKYLYDNYHFYNSRQDYSGIYQTQFFYKQANPQGNLKSGYVTLAKVWEREHDYKCNLEVANEVHESLKEREENYFLCFHGMSRAILLRDVHLLKTGTTI